MEIDVDTISKSETVNKIRSWHKNDEFCPIIIEGSHGYGKTTLACLFASEIYKTWNWNFLKNYIVFNPNEFLHKIEGKKIREPVMIWDDAGFWLHSLDYQNRWVKGVGKYLQVARTDWACIIFTCIDAEDILKKVRGVHNKVLIQVTKMGSSKKDPNFRTARIFESWKTPDKTRGGEEEVYTETFQAHMPDPFYKEYIEYRKGFTRQAKRFLREYTEKSK